MSKVGINDKILEKQIALQQRAIKKIGEMVKGSNPFAMERIDPDLKLWAVNNLGSEDVMDLINEYGEDKINQLIGEAKMYEMRRRKHA